MSTRSAVITGGLFAGVLAAAAFMLVPTPLGKLGLIARLRQEAVHVAPASAGGTTGTSPVFVAFDRTPGEKNLFYQHGSDVWEQRGRHRLLIRLSPRDPQLELDSYVTSILYLKQRLSTLSFHPFEARMPYRRAVAQAEQLFRRLNLHDAVDWDLYERRLDSPITNREVYVAEVGFQSATLQLFLNCRWDYDELPRSQVERAECYPIVYVNPNESATQ